MNFNERSEYSLINSYLIALETERERYFHFQPSWPACGPALLLKFAPSQSKIHLIPAQAMIKIGYRGGERS